MSKKAKILLSSLLAIVLLTAGGATAALAADEPADEDTPVRQELRARDCLDGEGFIERVERALEAGLITDDEAAEIIAWWEDRPAAADEVCSERQYSVETRNRIRIQDDSGNCPADESQSTRQIRKGRGGSGNTNRAVTTNFSAIDTGGTY
jgi:hypothetical protein